MYSSSNTSGTLTIFLVSTDYLNWGALKGFLINNYY